MARQPKVAKEAGDDDIDDVLKAIANRFAEMRKQLGLTQTQLGEKVGVKQSYVFELEQGEANITVRTLVRMARALDIDPRELIPGKKMAAPTRSDIQQLVSVLGRLAAFVEERIAQEERRSEQEQGFLEELRLFADLRKSLVIVDESSDDPASEPSKRRG